MDLAEKHDSKINDLESKLTQVQTALQDILQQVKREYDLHDLTMGLGLKSAYQSAKETLKRTEKVNGPYREI